MTQVLRSFAFGAVLLGLGSAAGWLLRGASSTSTREPPPAGTTRTSTPQARSEPRDRVIVQAVDQAGIREAVREAISEELAAARHADESEVAEPEPETVAALDSGTRYVEAAVVQGRWGEEQASQIRRLGVGLSAEQYHEMIRPLSIAINEGRMQVEVDGPPF
ncbi:MAG TPA: hypothetical protein VGK73_40675 [Polyangiaceae bacterium]